MPEQGTQGSADATPEMLREQGRTFRWDTVRAAPAGMLETAGLTFSILLADRVFEAGTWAKAVLVAVPPLGLLLSLFLVQFVRRSGKSVNTVLAGIFCLSGAGFAGAALAEERAEFYFLGMSIGLLGATMSTPLFAQIYRRHYPGDRRGRLFSVTAFVRKIFSISAAVLFGWWLSRDLGTWRWILLCFSGGSFLMAGVVLRIGTVTLNRSKMVHLFSAFRHVRDDEEFRRLLISWMFFGLGNLMCFSLFVEYITDERYGIVLGEWDISLITSVIPEAAFLITVLVWGPVFDRMKFYVLRALINVFFVIAIGLYFLGDGKGFLYAGIAMHGMAKAGGNVMWSLWVTRFADGEHVAEYMSVHTFLTGCRGVLAPFLAFQMAATLGPQMVAWISMGMITGATLFLGRRILGLPEKGQTVR